MMSCRITAQLGLRIRPRPIRNNLIPPPQGPTGAPTQQQASSLSESAPPSAPPPAPVSFRSIKPLPPLGETLRLVPFLSVCAMAGVLTRVGLNELFGPVLGSTSSTEGQTYPDWFANAWGSFAMGFLVPMRQAPFFAAEYAPHMQRGEVESKAQLLFSPPFTRFIHLDPHSFTVPWHSRSWLYVGLTTGYCGSTTTFSSWNQDAAALVVRSADVRLLRLSLLDFYFG